MPSHSADVGKLVEELIQKHQAEAGGLTLSEKAKYGDSSTVSTYTWVHSMKAMSQKFVRDLLDIQTALDEQPTISPDEVRGVVHCKDCKWCHAGYCEKYDDLIPWGCANKPWEDWFCADGKRREMTKEAQDAD